MHGQLSDRPLAEIICELTGSRLSGALRLARERARAVVYFEGGTIVAALANLRAARLVEFVRRAGSVEKGLLDEIEGKRLPDEGVAAELLNAGALTYGELRDLLTAQTSGVLRELLRWEAGEWEFDSRVRLAGAQRAQPDTQRLMIEHARQAPEGQIAQALGDDETLVPVDAASNPETLARLGLRPQEAFILSRVTGPTTLGELLLIGGLPEAETRRAAYVLVLCGLLERPSASRLFTAEALKQARPRTAEPQSATADTPQPAPPPTAAAPPPVEQPADSPAPPLKEERPAADAFEEVRAAMEELLELNRKTTHYEVLGVARTAGAADIKRAYHSLAKRLHPDRFRRDADGEMIQRLDASFARITQAYEVLKDTKLRAAYDLKLPARADAGFAPKVAQTDEGIRAERNRTTAETAAPAEGAATPSRAEERFQQGLAALQRGEEGRARQLLGEAALLAPREARYRAYYGRALARDRAARRQAEAELQAALALDEQNPSYRVMLAELYLEIGLRRRAESELRRALTLNPNHAAARRLLERLGGAA
jgi:curved DNA-binding protein CbpA